MLRAHISAKLVSILLIIVWNATGLIEYLGLIIMIVCKIIFIDQLDAKMDILII